MKLGYALYYVDDVEKTIEFYTKAFGLSVGFIHESKEYGELNTGETKLGFVHHNTAQSHGFKYEKMQSSKIPPAFEIGFVTPDVSLAFNKAVQNGAEALQEPKTKPWGQVVAYVRDCNGFLVEICTPMG